MVLNATLDNFRPGFSKQFARMVAVGGGTQAAVRDALTRTILDGAVKLADPSLGDVNWGAVGEGVDAIGAMLERGTETFTEIFGTITTAREAEAAAEHERDMARFAAETQAASEAAAAELEALSASATTSTTTTTLPPPSSGVPWGYIAGGVVVVGLIGGGIYALTR
jgi:hypothetical protein